MGTSFWIAFDFAITLITGTDEAGEGGKRALNARDLLARNRSDVNRFDISNICIRFAGTVLDGTRIAVDSKTGPTNP